MRDSFSLKTIQVSVTLGKGLFSEAGNTKIIEGLACAASVTKPGLPEKNSANIKIWGLNYADMAELSTLSFRPLEAEHNIIEIKAGELGQALAVVFQGEINGAYADFNQSPNPCMEFEAESGAYAQLISTPASAVQGESAAGELFARWAAEAGYAYQNQGVTTSVRNAWFPGSPMDKIIKLARDIGCELIIDDGVIITMPAGQPRRGNAVLLSKETGLIGYPTFNQDGISCRCIFNPDLIYGGLIKVESMVPKAGGVWKITKLSHDISAYSPEGGNWESRIEAAYNE